MQKKNIKRKFILQLEKQQQPTLKWYVHTLKHTSDEGKTSLLGLNSSPPSTAVLLGLEGVAVSPAKKSVPEAIEK